MRRKPFAPWARKPSIPSWNPGSQRGLLYLKRLFESRPELALPSLPVVLKAAGEDSMELIQAFIKILPNNRRNSIEREIAEGTFDEEDVVRIFQRKLISGARVTKNAYREILKFLGDRSKDLEDSGDLLAGVVKAGKMLQLTQAEMALCTFLYTLEDCEVLREYFFESLQCHRPSRRDILAVLLKVSEENLQQVFAGNLFRLGFVTIDKYGIDMAQELCRIVDNPAFQVLEEHFQPVGPEPVPLEAHPISEEAVRHVKGLLAAKRDFPINVLFYGPPGTGKTSFARGLVNALKVPCYFVSVSSEDQESRRFSIATSLVAANSGDGAIVLVDEADDILNTEFSWGFIRKSAGKAWLNQIMDTPGVRIIWITNQVDNIHESVRRRFNFSIAFRPFGPGQKRRLWHSVLEANQAAHLLPERDLDEVARRFSVTAGPMDTAVKTALAVSNGDPHALSKAITMGLSAYVTLQSNGEPVPDGPSVDDTFILEGLSLRGDVSLVLSHIERAHKYLKNHPGSTALVTALFYGPPGAGKTEFGRYIAHRLETELLIVDASDLLSKYVGETEKNIREVFGWAASTEAVLMIDEIDSLLFNRARAAHSWEVGMTNAMLTALERFRGVFIATTNRLEDLDEASLRRFHHKIGFDYLSSSGKRLLYDKFLAPLPQVPMDGSCRKLLEGIQNLTPGDFRVVWEKYRFLSKAVTHEELLEALQCEAEVKNRHRGKAPAGF